MMDAFQEDAFQNDAFQMTVTPASTGRAARGGIRSFPRFPIPPQLEEDETTDDDDLFAAII